jgi:hypothetical protein
MDEMEKPDPLNEPYPNEHACRLVDPGTVDVLGSGEITHDGKRIRVIFARKKGDKTGSLIQAYRYPKDVWTADAARAHCKDRDGILFEPATGESQVQGKAESQTDKTDEKSEEEKKNNMTENQNESATTTKTQPQTQADEGIGRRHPDFERIYQAFMKHYGPTEGGRRYNQWLGKTGLDETKPYRLPQQQAESFKWAQPMFQVLKDDADYVYYKVEAAFPITSLNDITYTKDELMMASRTMKGQPVNLNHVKDPLKDTGIEDAEYEDGATELILKVKKGGETARMIDAGEIMQVSIEGECRAPEVKGDKTVCHGLHFTGLALLTKDNLPGVPLTRIMPLETMAEKIAESYIVVDVHYYPPDPEKEPEETEETEETEEREWDTAYINNLPDDAFAYIEPGTKDDQGKTVPRTNRSLPYKNAQGNIDLPHLRNAFARLFQTSLSADAKAKALKKLCAAAKSVDMQSPLCEELAKQEKAEAEADAKAKAEAEKKAMEEAEKQKKAKECAPCVLTKAGYVRRYKELREAGLSRAETNRIIVFEMLEAGMKREQAEAAKLRAEREQADKQKQEQGQEGK